jgi:hypothetical protein
LNGGDTGLSFRLKLLTTPLDICVSQSGKIVMGETLEQALSQTFAQSS